MAFLEDRISWRAKSLKELPIISGDESKIANFLLVLHHGLKRLHCGLRFDTYVYQCSSANANLLMGFWNVQGSAIVSVIPTQVQNIPKYCHSLEIQNLVNFQPYKRGQNMDFQVIIITIMIIKRRCNLNRVHLFKFKSQLCYLDPVNFANHKICECALKQPSAVKPYQPYHTRLTSSL